MQIEPDEARKQFEARYRILQILWGALVSSVGFYFAISIVVSRPDSEDAPSRVLTFALTAMAVFLVIISFTIKQKFFAQAEEKQEAALVQTGLIIALSFCDAGALFGLLDFFTTGNRYYFVTFVVALLGMLLHFPRRDQLAASGYRRQDQIRGM